MNHSTPGRSARLSTRGLFPPMQIEILARAVMQRESLPWRELPRCRQEIRLQLLLTGMSARSARPRPVQPGPAAPQPLAAA